MLRTMLSMAVLALCCSTTANGSIRFDRNTTLTDTAGGTMITRSTGDFAAESGRAVSEAAFHDFAPRDGRGKVNGSINQTRDREGALITLRYAGNLTLNLPANSSGQSAGTVTVAFDDLSVVRAEEGRTIDGHIVINGREMAAEDAPRSIIAVLIGLVGLLRI